MLLATRLVPTGMDGCEGTGSVLEGGWRGEKGLVGSAGVGTSRFGFYIGRRPKNTRNIPFCNCGKRW